MTDLINHPPHYTAHPSGIECIQITEHMGFCLWNAVKYIWRADLKGSAIDDLQKARWYIDREIAKRGGERTPAAAELSSEALVTAAWLLQHITSTQRLVLVALAFAADPATKIAQIRVPNLAHHTGLSDRAVQNNLRALEFAQVIATEPQRYGPSRYTLLLRVAGK